jgi:hypothetical protein
MTGIGARVKTMNSDVEAALIGAALLSVLLFPTIAGFLLSGAAPPVPSVDAERPS